MAEPAREGEGEAAFAEAERLVREAEHAARAAAGAVPPGGWAAPGGQPAGPAFPDLAALYALLDALRGSLPPELAGRLADALRELLLALRAILDHSIARLERPRGADGAPSAGVEDIPVD